MQRDCSKSDRNSGEPHGRQPQYTPMLRQHRYNPLPHYASPYEPGAFPNRQSMRSTQSAGPHRKNNDGGYSQQQRPMTAMRGTQLSSESSGTYKRYGPYLKVVRVPPVDQQILVCDVKASGEDLKFCTVNSSGNLSQYISPADLSLPPLSVRPSHVTRHLLFNGNTRTLLSLFLELRRS